MARSLIAAIYMALLFAWAFYRAATQSFTTDEAYSYKLFIGAEPFSLLRQYDANLHVLHTLATWISVKLFGLSELTFRLPSLTGCALYLAGIAKITKRTPPRAQIVALVLLTANPLIQDHMSVGRGYGLALAFLAWAFAEALADSPRLTRIAVFLALCVGSNLTFLFPAAALIAALMIQRRSLLLSDLTGPWLTISALFWIVPLSRAMPDAFYFGAPTVPLSLLSLAEFSFGARPLPLPAVTAGAAILLVACAATYKSLPSLTLLLTACAVWLCHTLFGMPMPYARTGIYFLLLAPLCLLPLARWTAGVAALAVVAFGMASGNHSGYYMEWRFDAANRQIVDLISARGPDHARIAASPPLSSGLSLYAVMRTKAWEIPATPVWEPGYDYYVIREGTEDQLAPLGLHQIFSSPVSQTKVFVP